MKKKRKEKKESRRRSFIVYLLLIIGLFLIYAHYVEPKNIVINEYKIENSLIPKSFEGIKIVHFSDIHFGTTVDYEYLNKIVNIMNKQNPDIVIFTGDLFDKRVKPTNKEVEKINKILSKINSKIGNYAVTGNHDDYYLNDYHSVMENSFIILNNEEKLIYYKDSKPISIIGFDNKKPNYNVLNSENDYFKIVLSHKPDIYNKIKTYNFNVMLSGHSHGGQIRIPFIGPIYTPKGAKTYYDNYYKVDNKELFVSNGIGTSTIDLRFNSKPSINLYRLYAQ